MAVHKGGLDSLNNHLQNAISNPYLDHNSYQRQMEETLRLQALMGQYTSQGGMVPLRRDPDDNLVLLLLAK